MQHLSSRIIFKSLYKVNLKFYSGHLLIDAVRIPSVHCPSGPLRLPCRANGYVRNGLVWRGRSAAILPAVPVQQLQPFSHLAVVGYLLPHEVLASVLQVSLDFFFEEGLLCQDTHSVVVNPSSRSVFLLIPSRLLHLSLPKK
jgi:hypothetical protein